MASKHAQRGGAHFSKTKMEISLYKSFLPDLAKNIGLDDQVESTTWMEAVAGRRSLTFDDGGDDVRRFRRPLMFQ